MHLLNCLHYAQSVNGLVGANTAMHVQCVTTRLAYLTITYIIPVPTVLGVMITGVVVAVPVQM